MLGQGIPAWCSMQDKVVTAMRLAMPGVGSAWAEKQAGPLGDRPQPGSHETENA